MAGLLMLRADCSLFASKPARSSRFLPTTSECIKDASEYTKGCFFVMMQNYVTKIHVVPKHEVLLHG